MQAYSIQFATLLRTNSLSNVLKVLWDSQKIFRKWFLMGSLIKNLQDCIFQLCVFLKLLKLRPLWCSFLHKQALTGSPQNNCCKQLLKRRLPRRPANVFQKGFLLDLLLHNKPQIAKIKTSKGKIKFLQCRCPRLCRYWCRYVQMVLGNYSKLFRCKNSGTENWVCTLF